jgi:hypothetical protein
MKHIRKSLFCMLALLLMPACVFAINDLVTIRSNVMGYEDGDLVFDEATGDKTWSIKNVRAYGVGRYWSLTPETFVDRYGQQGVRIPSEFNVEEIHFTITSKFKVDGEIEVGEKFAELYLSSGNNGNLTFAFSDDRYDDDFTVDYYNQTFTASYWGIQMKEQEISFDVTYYPTDYTDYVSLYWVELNYHPLYYYPLSLDFIDVTDQNMHDILGNGTASFDGQHTLVLNGANFSSGVYTSMEELTVYLKGDNKVGGWGYYGKGSFNAYGDGRHTLSFTTDGNNPGSLTLWNSQEQYCEGDVPRIIGFDEVFFKQNLAVTEGGFETNKAVIRTAVSPMVDLDTMENTVDMSGTENTDDLSNTVIDDVLYTLDEDDYEHESGNLLLQSTMVDSDVDAIIAEYTPGTAAFAEQFSGLTLMVPAGTGTITVNARTGEDGVLNVKVGKKAPNVISGALEFADFSFSYACAEATYVYIYSTSPVVQASARFDDHRAGKKTTVTIGLSSVGVSSSSVQPSNSEGNMGGNVVVLTDADVQYDADNETLVVINPNVNTLTDAMFVNFPFLKYMDLHNTQITGVDVSRSAGPFAGISKNTFIYMPAGNTTEESNVIIGNVCESVCLDAYMTEDESYGISDSFVASAVELNRLFQKDEMTTICLPFDISASDMECFGHLYMVKTVSDDVVQLDEVTSGLKAHVPYLFKSADDNTTLYTLDVVTMSMPEQQVNARAASTGQLIGCYDNFYSVGIDDAFRFVTKDNLQHVKFVRMQSADRIKPFEAYLRSDATSNELGVTGQVVTGIQTVADGQQLTVKSQYYDLQGRSVRALKKGIYIANGKKVVIR